MAASENLPTSSEQLPANKVGRSLGSKNIFGVRHVQVILLCLCLAVNLLMRVNLSVAVVLMTDINSTTGYSEFNWTLVEQSEAQSIFYLTYFLMSILSAFLVTIYSNKLLLLLSAAFSSALSLATPAIVTAGGLYALIISRLILGLTQGMMMANVMGIMSRWIPPTERSMCGSLIIGGWIGSQFGWPSIFYFSGILGALWTISWSILAADSPEKCWFITKEEKNFLEKELFQTLNKSGKTCKIPWKKIFKNKPCLALLLTALGHYWGNVIILSEMPTYFNSVLHLQTTDNGLISALPYACMLIFSLLFSYFVDVLIRSKRITVTNARKSCNSIGHWGAAICLLVLSYTNNETMILTMYTLGATLLGFAYFGFNINHLDIIPKYAGFFMGITSALTNVSSFLGPLFAGYVVNDAENINQWRIVFWVTALIWFVANSIFITFGSGEPQDFEDEKFSEGISSL